MLTGCGTGEAGAATIAQVVLGDRLPGAGKPIAVTDGGGAIDNTRVAHGRDAYTDPGRLLWRCWAWTDRSGSIPPGELWSDARMLLPAELLTQ